MSAKTQGRSQTSLCVPQQQRTAFRTPTRWTLAQLADNRDGAKGLRQGATLDKQGNVKRVSLIQTG